MVFFMATILGDVQYTQVMGHLTTPVQPTHPNRFPGAHDPRICRLTGRGGELCGQCAGGVRDAELHELVNGRDLATGLSMLSFF